MGAELDLIPDFSVMSAACYITLPCNKMVGTVGIAPTFRGFQARANLSQLCSRGRSRRCCPLVRSFGGFVAELLHGSVKVVLVVRFALTVITRLSGAANRFYGDTRMKWCGLSRRHCPRSPLYTRSRVSYGWTFEIRSKEWQASGRTEPPLDHNHGSSRLLV